MSQTETIRQGSDLTDHSFVVLICDKEDITEYAKQIDKELTKEQTEKAYQLAKRRLTDSIIENQFWYSIEAIIDEAIKE